MKLMATLPLLLALSGLPAEAGDPTSPPRPVGLSVAVETESMLGGRVVRVAVTKVAFGSQAKAVGVQEGDQVVQLHGWSVEGVDAKVLKLQMKFQPGQTKHITLKRLDGSQYEVALTRPVARTQ